MVFGLLEITPHLFQGRQAALQRPQQVRRVQGHNLCSQHDLLASVDSP